MISYASALKLISKHCKPQTQTEVVKLAKAAGRTLAEDICADRDYPPFNRATMDGFAVVSPQVRAETPFSVKYTLYPGQELPDDLLIDKSKDCIQIMTGAAVPAPFDAVIRIEDSRPFDSDQKVMFKETTIHKGQNIAKRGEDCHKGKSVILKNTEVTYAAVGALASLGQSDLKVYRLPRVAIISTGSELVAKNKAPKTFQIRDANSEILSQFLNQYGIQPAYRFLVGDEENALFEKMKIALECDIVLLSGAVSAGKKDFVPEVLKSLGVKKIFHKVAVKPGKPVLFGMKGNTAIFALPGNPMSCQIGAKVFVEPYLRKFLRLLPNLHFQLPVKTALNKNNELTHFFPAKIKNVHGETLVEPLKLNTSGDFISTTTSHGYGIHPAEQKNIAEGQRVDFFLWHNR